MTVKIMMFFLFLYLPFRKYYGYTAYSDTQTIRKNLRIKLYLYCIHNAYQNASSIKKSLILKAF